MSALSKALFGETFSQRNERLPGKQEFGEHQGHPFRGNQYQTVAVSAEEADRAVAGTKTPGPYYHGTSGHAADVIYREGFKEGARSYQGESRGIYFSKKAIDAQYMADTQVRSGNGQVLEARLNITNPLPSDKAIDALRSHDWSDDEHLIVWAEKRGYDGIERPSETIAFRPDQVKLVETRKSATASAHDVSDEPRASDGKWTTGGDLKSTLEDAGVSWTEGRGAVGEVREWDLAGDIAAWSKTFPEGTVFRAMHQQDLERVMKKGVLDSGFDGGKLFGTTRASDTIPYLDRNEVVIAYRIEPRERQGAGPTDYTITRSLPADRILGVFDPKDAVDVGAQSTYKEYPTFASAHDVSDEPRAADGKWTRDGDTSSEHNSKVTQLDKEIQAPTKGAAALAERLRSDGPEGVKALFADDPRYAIATDLNLNNAPSMAVIEKTRQYVADRSQLALRKEGQPEMMTVYRGGEPRSEYTSVTLQRDTAKFFADRRPGATVDTYQVPISKVAAYIPAFDLGLGFNEAEIYLKREDLGPVLSRGLISAAVLEFEHDVSDEPRDDHGRWTSGGSDSGHDGTAGETKQGLAGQNSLRAAMIEGLHINHGIPVDDPRSWTSLTDANDMMRGQAKAEIVEAAGKDIADAAVNDPAVREEMLAQYPHLGENDPSSVSGWSGRDTLETDWMDRQVGNWTPEELAAKSDEQLYGEIKAQAYVDSWAGSAADHEPISLSLQRTTAELLDAKSSSFENYVNTDPPNDLDMKFARDRMEQLSDREGATMRAFVQGEYDRTQAFLKDSGITEVTLHRGFYTDGVVLPEPGPYPVSMNPASSWTVDRSTAVMFSDSSEADHNFVLTMTVPAEDIISTSRTGRGALHEGEVLVRNQPGAVAYWNAGGEGSPDA